MNEQLRVGLLGVGNIGSVHLRSISVMDGVRVTAVADADSKNRNIARKKTGCQTYSDYKELLESEEIDMAVISLPPFLHADATIRSAEQGVHVFVEKPFARSTDEAESMVDAAKQHDIKLGVDHTIRYQTDMQKMKQKYDQGYLGHVPLCYISRINNGPFSTPPKREPVADWKLDPEMAGGGVVLALGVHLLDVLEWFFGEMSVEYAHMDSQLNTSIEDSAVLVLKSSQSNTMAVLTCGAFQWESLPDVNMSFRLEGTTDHLENQSFIPDSLELHAAKSMLENIARRRLKKKKPNFFEPTYYYQAHYRALGDFVESIIKGEKPPVSGEQGLRTVELAENAYHLSNENYGF